MAGALNTFARLAPTEAQPQLAAVARDLAEDETLSRGTAHLALCVALRGSTEELRLPASNMWLTPGAAHDAQHAAYMADPEGAPFNAAFISFPSAKDPTWPERHPGTSTCHIIADAGGWERWQAWADERVKHRGAEYAELKGRLSARLLHLLYREFPQLRGRVVFSELGTPLSSAFYIGAAHGESYGLAGTPARFRLTWLQPRSPLAGLYLVGVDILSPGFVGALVSGALTAITICPRVAWDNLRAVVRL